MAKPIRLVVVLAALPPEVGPLARGLRGVPDVRVVATGVGLRRAAAVARREGPGAGLLVSAGCCGGLAPAAVAGTLVVPRRVLRDSSEGETPPPDGTWGSRLRDAARAAGHLCMDGAIVSVRRALATAEEKRACRERTGADAVDMETASVAQVAAELGVPYVSIRVVLDTAGEAIPQAPLDADGRLELRRLLLLAHPRTLLSLAALALRLRQVMPRLVACLRAAL
jgi:adenosylhomocysteine nucleosidase